MIKGRMLKFRKFTILQRMALLKGAVAILLLLMISCERSSSQLHFKNLGSEGWLQHDTLLFEVDSLLETGHYRLSVAMRTSSAKRYPYRQLVLQVRQNWNRDSLETVDTLFCHLAKPDGEIKGDGVSIYAYEFPLDTLSLDEGWCGKIYLRHLMRKSPLDGIYNIGVLLEKCTP